MLRLVPFACSKSRDRGIAQDYAPNGDSHREYVRRYLSEFLARRSPAGAEQAAN